MTGDDVLDIVSDVFGVSSVRISSKDRSHDVTMAKIAYCGLTKNSMKATEINVLLGISAPSLRKFILECDKMLKTDNGFKVKYERVQNMINK